MGLTTSTTTYQPPARKYTDADIRKNIDELFNNARTNNFSEGSYSINDLNNIVIPDIENIPRNIANIAQNGGIKFNPSQKRYLKYNLQGGNDSFEEISDMSEFQRIKEYLINDMKIINLVVISIQMMLCLLLLFAPPSNQNLVDLLNALKGGKDRLDDDDDDDDDKALEEAVDVDEGELEEEDEDEDEDEDDDDESEEKKKKRQNQEKKKILMKMLKMLKKFRPK